MPACYAARMPGTRRLGRVAALLLTLIPAAASAQKISNPDLFGKSLAAAGEAVEQYHRWDDPATLRRVADIGYRVAAASGYTEFPVTFFLVDRVPNAFTLPGGQIFVTRGLLDLGWTTTCWPLCWPRDRRTSPWSLKRMQRKATLINCSGTPLVGVMLASENRTARQSGRARTTPAPRTTTGGDVHPGGRGGEPGPHELLLRSYSREHEDEADAEGPAPRRRLRLSIPRRASSSGAHAPGRRSPRVRLPADPPLRRGTHHLGAGAASCCARRRRAPTRPTAPPASRLSSASSRATRRSMTTSSASSLPWR